MKHVVTIISTILFFIGVLTASSASTTEEKWLVDKDNDGYPALICGTYQLPCPDNEVIELWPIEEDLDDNNPEIGNACVEFSICT